MKGDTASAASGAGAPYLPQRELRAEEMVLLWLVERVRLALMAHALPSCGWRVVVSLSLYRPLLASQSFLLAADLIPLAILLQLALF